MIYSGKQDRRFNPGQDVFIGQKPMTVVSFLQTLLFQKQNDYF